MKKRRNRLGNTQSGIHQVMSVVCRFQPEFTPSALRLPHSVSLLLLVSGGNKNPTEP